MPFCARPSMVVTLVPTAPLTGNEQERVATPSTCTVQAPHCAMPHPYLVPVSPTFSRIAQRSGVSSSTSTLIDLPLIVRFAIAYPLLAQSIHRESCAREDGLRLGIVQIKKMRLRPG